MVSTNLLLLLPSVQARDRAFARLFRRRKRRGRKGPKDEEEDAPWDDWQVVNHEFSCNDETHPLQQGYSEADYKFLAVS